MKGSSQGGRVNQPRYPLFGRAMRKLVLALRIEQDASEGRIEDNLADSLATSVSNVRKLKSGERRISDQETLIRLATLAKEGTALGRGWANELFLAAGYREQEVVALTNSVWGVSPTRNIPLHLPWHDLTQFVDRPKLLAQVFHALAIQSYQGIVITGMSGVGKTRVVAETAWRCAAASNGDRGETGLPVFDAIVWIDLDDLLLARIDEADRSIGQDLVAAVIDTIARTLGYLDRTGTPLSEMIRLIDRALREQRLLVILDNVISRRHSDVLRWAMRMPFPSKVVLISTERLHSLAQTCMIIPVGGMEHDEALELIKKNADKLELSYLLPRVLTR